VPVAVTDPSDISPDDNALAAEYALGLLSPDEGAAVEARLGTDPAFLAQVLSWQAEFAGLAEAEVAPVTPRSAVKARIDAALFGTPKGSIWSRLSFWRGLAITGFASSAALAALLLLAPLPQPLPQVPLVAQLEPVTGGAQFLAVFDPDTSELRVQRSAGTAATGRVQQLWLIAGEDQPVSLGLLDDSAVTVLTIDASAADLFPDAVLAVSDEPPGGSPTGAPTGDVLAAGPVISL